MQLFYVRVDGTFFRYSSGTDGPCGIGCARQKVAMSIIFTSPESVGPFPLLAHLPGLKILSTRFLLLLLG